MNFGFKSRLLARFERYAKVDTQSDENSKSCPSTKGQLALGGMLVREMLALGIKNAAIDKNGYVTGEIKANTAKKIPAIGFLAHLDTSPDMSGKDVRPQVHKNYAGGAIIIKKGHTVLSPKDCPQLLECVGHDIVTASGDTLLGADNKAGIAVIMTAAEYLLANPGIKHGPVKIAFTPDEEIGRGADKFDIKAFGAKYAYTFDGDTAGTLEGENFNADGVTITIKGKNCHPGTAKNVMANAVRIAADIVSSWPENMLPEATAGHEGFIMFLSCGGSAEEAALKGIAREHDLKKLRGMERLLSAIIREKQLKYPAARIKLEFKKQYRNMKEIMDRQPAVINYAVKAIEREGLQAVKKPIRGGTDGARLSFMGLPTPNIFTGGYNYHGRFEWVSVDNMEKSARVLVGILREWEQARGAK